jgi:hypothetical protein
MLKYDFKNETEKQKNEIKSNCFSNLKKLFSMLKKKPESACIKKNIENNINKLKTLKENDTKRNS